MKSRLKIAAVTFGVALAATACGSTQTPVESAAQETTATSEWSATEEAPPIETPAPAEETTPEASAYAFGQTVTFDDGMRVTIGKPAAFKPSEYAAGTEGFTRFVKFRITIENRTGKAFDPTMATMTLLSGETEGSEVYDSEHNLGSGPSTKLLNSRKVTYTVGFGVKDPKDIVVEYSLSFEHQAAMFSLTGM